MSVTLYCFEHPNHQKAGVTELVFEKTSKIIFFQHRNGFKLAANMSSESGELLPLFLLFLLFYVIETNCKFETELS